MPRPPIHPASSAPRCRCLPGVSSSQGKQILQGSPGWKGTSQKALSNTYSVRKLRVVNFCHYLSSPRLLKKGRDQHLYKEDVEEIPVEVQREVILCPPH